VLQSSRVELEKHVERLVLERENQKKTIEQSKQIKSEEARVRKSIKINKLFLLAKNGNFFTSQHIKLWEYICNSRRSVWRL